MNQSKKQSPEEIAQSFIVDPRHLADIEAETFIINHRMATRWNERESLRFRLLPVRTVKNDFQLNNDLK